MSLDLRSGTSSAAKPARLEPQAETIAHVNAPVDILAGIADYTLDVMYQPNFPFTRYLNIDLSAAAGITQIGLGFGNAAVPAFSQLLGTTMVEISVPLAMFEDIMFLLKNLKSPSIEVAYDPAAQTLAAFRVHGLSS